MKPKTMAMVIGALVIIIVVVVLTVGDRVQTAMGAPPTTVSVSV